MEALATVEDYEMLIGSVADSDEPRLEFMLRVASSVVVGVAPGLLPWTNGEAETEVPENAVLVTCQTASALMADPTGGSGAVSMERVGLVETQYATADVEALLPVAWRQLLLPWRPPTMAAIKLVVPHPLAYEMDGWGGDWWFLQDDDVVAPRLG